MSQFTNSAGGSMKNSSSLDFNNHCYSQSVANGIVSASLGGRTTGSNFPLSESTALSNLTSTAAAISTTPQRQYVRCLTGQANYIFVAMRFGAV